MIKMSETDFEDKVVIKVYENMMNHAWISISLEQRASLRCPFYGCDYLKGSYLLHPTDSGGLLS